MSEQFEKATDNIVKICLQLNEQDKLIIISDHARKSIGKAIHNAAEKICDSKLLLIEDYIDRPAKFLPADLTQDIKEFEPTASVYAATGEEGELQNFRSPLTEILTEELDLRHAHMIGIDENIMLDGMSKDYNKIQKAVSKLFDIAKDAKEIKVTDRHGSNFTVEFTKEHKWKKDDGLLDKPGKWNNLPAGEVFTAPKSLNGKIAGFIVGDYFSDKYGLLDSPVIIEVEDSLVKHISGNNKKLNKELQEYLKTDNNSNRVGELGIGCLLGITKLTGNLLQDEKYPGVHVAFGSPYPEATGADWDSSTHVDVIPLDVNIKVDEEKLMEDGEYLIDFE